MTTKDALDIVWGLAYAQAEKLFLDSGNDAEMKALEKADLVIRQKLKVSLGLKGEQTP